MRSASDRAAAMVLVVEGEEALSDVITLDLGLLGLDGLEVMRTPP